MKLILLLKKHNSKWFLCFACGYQFSFLKLKKLLKILRMQDSL